MQRCAHVDLNEEGVVSAWRSRTQAATSTSNWSEHAKDNGFASSSTSRPERSDLQPPLTDAPPPNYGWSHICI